MAKFKFKLKKSWKSIVSMVLAGVAVLGAIFGVVAISKKLSADTKEIHPTFNVGAIDSQGNYMESDTSIYTKNLFECQGLSIEPDFEATGTFSVYYYDANKHFITTTGEMDSSDGVYTKGDTFILAQYARIVITPDVPVDEDGNEVEKFKIRFYEVAGYANDYTITVNKKQNFEAINYTSWISGSYYDWLDGGNDVKNDEAFQRTPFMNCHGIERFNVELKDDAEGVITLRFAFLDEDGELIYDEFSGIEYTCTNSGTVFSKTVNVPDNAVKIAFYSSIPKGSSNIVIEAN